MPPERDVAAMEPAPRVFARSQVTLDRDRCAVRRVLEADSAKLASTESFPITEIDR